MTFRATRPRSETVDPTAGETARQAAIDPARPRVITDPTDPRYGEPSAPGAARRRRRRAPVNPHDPMSA
jgi:hypothetical protein